MAQRACCFLQQRHVSPISEAARTTADETEGQAAATEKQTETGGRKPMSLPWAAGEQKKRALRCDTHCDGIAV